MIAMTLCIVQFCCYDNCVNALGANNRAQPKKSITLRLFDPLSLEMAIDRGNHQLVHRWISVLPDGSYQMQLADHRDPDSFIRRRLSPRKGETELHVDIVMSDQGKTSMLRFIRAVYRVVVRADPNTPTTIWINVRRDTPFGGW